MFQLSEKYNEYIQINEYNGQYALALTKIEKDGKEKIQWCVRKFGDKERKSIVGLRFESEEQLKAFAEWLHGKVCDTPF